MTKQQALFYKELDEYREWEATFDEVFRYLTPLQGEAPMEYVSRAATLADAIVVFKKTREPSEPPRKRPRSRT